MKPSLAIQRPTNSAAVRTMMDELRSAHQSLPPTGAIEMVNVLTEWGARLTKSPIMAAPGVVFLTLWLREGTLRPLLTRELGEAALRGDWGIRGSSGTFPLPLGVVGHFPAGNIAIQPLLSMACGILGGNAGVVRVPSGLEEFVKAAIQPLEDADTFGKLAGRLRFVSIASDRRDLLSELASGCDGAMIWGGQEAVLAVRSLPFPHWARIATFGPRTSVAFMNAAAWTDENLRADWCRRLARDVWQFEQRACSSPQVLYVERARDGIPIKRLIDALQVAFEAENEAHPRAEFEASAAVEVARARADWLTQGNDRSARFPFGPDWTILLGKGIVWENPVQSKCLFVSVVDDLHEAVASLDGNVQAVGLGCSGEGVEASIAEGAARRGVDRITQLGRMHLFDSPWDGRELVAPMTRLVRYTPAQHLRDSAVA